MRAFDPHGPRNLRPDWGAKWMNKSDRDPCPGHHLNFCKIDPALRYIIVKADNVKADEQSRVEIGCIICGETWSIPNVGVSPVPGQWRKAESHEIGRLIWMPCGFCQSKPGDCIVHANAQWCSDCGKHHTGECE